MDTVLVELIKTPFIEEYRWNGDSLYIWVADYNWSYFKTIFKKMVLVYDEDEGMYDGWKFVWVGHPLAWQTELEFVKRHTISDGAGD